MPKPLKPLIIERTGTDAVDKFQDRVNGMISEYNNDLSRTSNYKHRHLLTYGAGNNSSTSTTVAFPAVTATTVLAFPGFVNSFGRDMKIVTLRLRTTFAGAANSSTNYWQFYFRTHYNDVATGAAFLQDMFRGTTKPGAPGALGSGDELGLLRVKPDGTTEVTSTFSSVYTYQPQPWLNGPVITSSVWQNEAQLRTWKANSWLEMIVAAVGTSSKYLETLNVMLEIEELS